MHNPRNQAYELEAEVRQRVSRHLSLIEIALANWEYNKEKPEKFEYKIRYMRQSYRLLASWEMESLKGRRDYNSTIIRLRKFRDIWQDILERKEKILHGRY